MTFQLSGNAPEIYERVLVPLWFGRWATKITDLLALSAGERVLDVACGTGVTTRMARDRVGPTGRVDGLDINHAMLAIARDLADGRDIEWIEGDVTDVPRPEQSYDVVMSQHGYHYFPDKDAALQEFRRLLVPGGRIALSIWDGPSPYTRAVCDAVERHISPRVAQAQRAQRQTPDAAELRAQVARAGFAKVAVHRQELAIDVPPASEFVPLHLGSMPIAADFAALKAEARAALIDDVARAMKPHERDGRLVYPDAVHVVTGQR